MFVCRNRTSFFSGNEKGRARVVQFLWVLPTIMKTALYAFDNGAVVPSVRERFISLYRTVKDKPDIPQEYVAFLNKVYKILMNATLEELVEISHEDNEWRIRNPHRENQCMDSLSRVEEYKKQYADILKVMERMDMADE